MQLTYLSLYLQEYGSHKGSYQGEVKFTGDYGSTTIKLDAQLSQEVLKICADSLVRQTKATAQIMTANILEQVPAALSAPSE